jgi:hypothetical protein
MRSLVLTLAFLASCRSGGQNSQEFSHEMRAMKGIASIHTAETNFQSRTGRYASLKELPVELPDEWSFALSLTPDSGYTIAVLPHDTHSYRYFSDQTMAIRRCPPGLAERACPVIGEPPVLRWTEHNLFNELSSAVPGVFPGIEIVGEPSSGLN